MAFRAVYLTMMMCIISGLLNSYSEGGSCKEIKDQSPSAPSGIYHLSVVGHHELIEVYCEMGLNGGGYTFLSPRAMAEITDENLQSLITDRRSVLMRIRRCDGTQPYSVLQQLPQYQHLPIWYHLNNFTGYQGPVNLGTVGSPYLYTGFLPRSVAGTKTVQGLVANGVSLTFSNCDANGNSQITMYPNFNEKAVSGYGINDNYAFCNNIFNGAKLNPSTRVMPPEYYVFAEFHFGGCGCYSQTDQRLRNKCILGFQIGFR